MAMGKKSATTEPGLFREGSEIKGIKLSLFAAAVSATLRVVVPTIGLFLIGLMIDFWRLQTAFYALIGAALGFLLAAFLIYRQIKKLRIQDQDFLINDHDGVLNGGSDQEITDHGNQSVGLPQDEPPELEPGPEPEFQPESEPVPDPEPESKSKPKSKSKKSKAKVRPAKTGGQTRRQAERQP